MPLGIVVEFAGDVELGGHVPDGVKKEISPANSAKEPLQKPLASDRDIMRSGG
jgi:hypothetical protein